MVMVKCKKCGSVTFTAYEGSKCYKCRSACRPLGPVKSKKRFSNFSFLCNGKDE
jgi:uncharacterized OB-fold protein